MKLSLWKPLVGCIVENVDIKLRIHICGSYRRGKKDSGDMDAAYSNKRTDGPNEYMFERVIEQFTLDNFIVDSLDTS